MFFFLLFFLLFLHRSVSLTRGSPTHTHTHTHTHTPSMRSLCAFHNEEGSSNRKDRSLLKKKCRCSSPPPPPLPPRFFPMTCQALCVSSILCMTAERAYHVTVEFAPRVCVRVRRRARASAQHQPISSGRGPWEIQLYGAVRSSVGTSNSAAP